MKKQRTHRRHGDEVGRHLHACRLCVLGVLKTRGKTKESEKERKYFFFFLFYVSPLTV